MALLDARATLADGRLALAGALTATHVPVLWAQIGRAQYRQLDLAAVSAADSAALAMLSRLQENNPQAEVVGLPTHLDALRQAYRLDSQLRFTA